MHSSHVTSVRPKFKTLTTNYRLLRVLAADVRCAGKKPRNHANHLRTFSGYLTLSICGRFVIYAVEKAPCRADGHIVVDFAGLQ